MAASAILLVGKHSFVQAGWGESSQDYFFEAESMPAQVPVACLEVLGASVLERTVERLRRSGVYPIYCVVDDARARFLPPAVKHRVLIERVQQAGDEQLAVERVFGYLTKVGAEDIFLIRVEAYIDFDPASILRFHRANQAPWVSVGDRQGFLEFWVIRSSRTMDLAGILDSAAELEPPNYLVDGYVNRLRRAKDLRHLVVDAFLGNVELGINGRQIRPGIWIAEGASVDRRARLVAPVYVGRKTKIQAASLVTRFSNLEGGCALSRGTIIEDASILPRTFIGKGLEISHAVVDGSRFVHLTRDVAVQIHDPRLIHRIEPWRFLQFARRAGERMEFSRAAEIIAAASIGQAPAAFYASSSKEQYDERETRNR